MARAVRHASCARWLLIAMVGMASCGGKIGGEIPETSDAASDDMIDGARAVSCEDTYAYLHGDLWPMWYNMRVACDPEHKALWRCERTHGTGAGECEALASRYDTCITTWGSPWPCLNYGVYAPVTDGNECSGDEPDADDTRTFDYDSPDVWGSYYGKTWGSSTDLHRFLTIKIENSSGELVAAYSARPGSGDAYMDGLENFGVGPEPQGFIQLIDGSSPGKYEDRFGTFACLRVPAGESLTLWAAWMNEFAHTCSPSYPSQPDTPCWVEHAAQTFSPGSHYLWTERGIEQAQSCAGPPDEILARLPGASCSTELR